jgi:N-acetylneuraminic acid mutarotase/uncharacterized coiled-coil protein SlyX
MRAIRLVSGLVVGFLLLSGLMVAGIVVNPAQAALTPTWVAQDPMPAAKAQAQIAATDDGMIYLMGGVESILSASHEYDVAVPDSYVFNSETGAWSAIAPMPYGARSGVAMAGDDGKVYVFGGYNQSWGSLAFTQIYDPADDSWTLGTAMTYAEGFVTGAKGFDGRMYVMGGNDVMGYLQIYDPVGDSWSMGAAMPTPLFAGSAVPIYDGAYIVYVGGSSNWGSASALVQYYDVDWDSWGTMDSLPMANAACSAVYASDGLIYVMGGGNQAYNTGGLLGGQEFFETTYFYSLYDETWDSAVDLPYGARYGMAAATEGKIWFFGGNNNTVVYDDVSMMQIMTLTASLSSTTVAQGESVFLMVNPQFAYLSVSNYYMVVYVEDPTGYAYPSIEVSTSVDTPFQVEIAVPEIAELGDHTIITVYLAASTGWTSLMLELDDLTLTVVAMVPIEDLIAELEADLADLQAALASADANVTALGLQVAVMQAKLDAIIAGMTAMGEGQAAAMADLNETLADLQLQLDDFQEQIDRIESKADTAGTYGIVTMVLVIVIIALVALMFMMARKKP